MIYTGLPKDCHYYYNCCDCGGCLLIGCQCTGCFSCNACDNCLNNDSKHCELLTQIE